eukprot:gene17683-19448_t
MALFAAASKHFVKSAGHETLHSVPDLNSADRFKVLCLVKRKKSFWIWKKPKIIPTMITLNDVMEKPIDNVTSLIVPDTIIAEKYKDTPSFNADGDIGAKIATELDIDLSMTDKFSLNVDFGDIVKTKVKWEALEKKLASLKINLNHALFQEVAKSKRTRICIVLESLACKALGPLEEDVDVKETGTASATVPKVTTVSVNVHMKEDVESKAHHSYTIPAGTIIAFSCTKMDIDDNGILRMHVGVDKVDNIDETQVPIPSPEKIGDKMKSDLAPLIKSAKFLDIKKVLLEIFKTPQCLDGLAEIVSMACMTVEENREFSLSAEIVNNEMGGVKDWKSFLELLYFKVPVSITKGSKIQLPTDDQNGLLSACLPLVEAAADLDEKDVKALIKCSSSNGDKLLQILADSMVCKDTPYSDVASIMEGETNEKKFLLGFGYKVFESNGAKFLGYNKWGNHNAVRDAFALVYVLLCN